MINFFEGFEEKSSELDINAGDFIFAAEIPEKYITEKKDGKVFVDAKAPFVGISGLKHPDDNCGEYYRLDPRNKEKYSESNKWLAKNTSGGRISFRTDSDNIMFKFKLNGGPNGMHHFADRGVYGLDVYSGTGSKRKYEGGQMQTFADNPEQNEQGITVAPGMQQITVELPLYSGIDSFAIGISENAKIGLPLPGAFENPIGFYGSSITQGGCVSRPGNMYSNILCRIFDADCRNFGFSGSALGEQVIAEYIGNTPMTAFVMDYDYNSESSVTLRATHEPFYKTVRKLQPDLPIVFVTHPYYFNEMTDEDRARKEVIKDTYNKAAAAGDKNVYYVDSESFFPTQMRDLVSVDILHPNDFGHYCMAVAIYPVLKKILGR